MLCVLLVVVERVCVVCVVFDDLFLDSLIGLNSLPPVIIFEEMINIID